MTTHTRAKRQETDTYPELFDLVLQINDRPLMGMIAPLTECPPKKKLPLALK